MREFALQNLYEMDLLIGEYKTEIHEDPNEKPKVGYSKRLNCYYSEENKGNPEAKQNDVRWIHNGHTVQNDDRHEGASTRVISSIMEISHATRIFQMVFFCKMNLQILSAI